MQANIGMAGEFRVVVKRADGSTKIDTGYQKNLILNQGLDFFGDIRLVVMKKYRNSLIIELNNLICIHDEYLFD